MSWWSNYYNRPLKDPILLSYTVEELTYEYYNVMERKKAAEERIEKENDMIEDAKRKEAEAWADMMEAEEEQEVTTVKKDPVADPDNAEWISKMMNEGKEEFGENFGEDVSLNFGG